MNEKSLFKPGSASSVVILCGWGALAAAFLVGLPQGWHTGIAAVTTIGCGLAWAMLVLAFAPFFKAKSRASAPAPVLGFRLAIALAYAAAQGVFAIWLALPPKPFPFLAMLGIQSGLFGIALVANVVAGLVGVKARQVESAEADLRQGLDAIKAQVAAARQLAKRQPEVFAGMAAGLERMGDCLGYTSPCNTPEAAASEERLLSGVQQLMDSMQFLQSLGSEAQGEPQLVEMRTLIVQLENEAAFRSHITS